MKTKTTKKTPWHDNDLGAKLVCEISLTMGPWLHIFK